MSVNRTTPRMTIFLLMAVILVTVGGGFAQTKAPKIFTSFLDPNKDYLGESVAIVTPKEIEKYNELIDAAGAKNPEWFQQFMKDLKPGVPVPNHKNLNLTPEQYQEYRALWDQRVFKPIEKVGVRLEQTGDKWRFLTSGQGARIPLLRYDEKTDTFKSTNGEMERIEDIDAAAETILGEWKGVEWRFLEETPLGFTKENFAIGKTGDGKYCFIVYRIQDISSMNTTLLDENQVLRIPLK